QTPNNKDVSAADQEIIAEALQYSMTNFDRLFVLMEAVRHIERRGIPGAFVECGVWRGGSILAMLRTLLALGVTNRDFYLYDTFEGMTAPTEVDVSAYHGSALAAWKSAVGKGERAWNELFNEKVFNEEDVRRVLLSTGYPSERLHFVKGTVEQTIPATVPDAIALLRLDTDWYESTRHEMQHLYPLIAQGGVLIIDDYGHWDGCRKAIDEYFSAGHTPPMLLNRVEYSCRIGVKDGV
ncbi:MAG: TylF/MycF/NovP-related O-methyltransferase, partial [Stenotrophobium sp.]